MNDFGKKIYVFAIICLMYFPHDVVSYYQYPSVYWAPKNCRFNLNKPPNTGYNFTVKPFGKLYFVCPNIALWNDMSSTGPQLSMMYENLMLVDKEGYDTCTVNKSRNPRLNRAILKCDGDASKLKYMQETFSRQRADPHRMKYNKGQTYYFISTSNGSKESLDNLSGGHCKTHNMKLKITVCGSQDRCTFRMPKCPFTNVFYKPTTATTTQARTSQTTGPENTARVATTEKNTATVGTTETTAKPTTQKETNPGKTEKTKVKKGNGITLVTNPPTQPKTSPLKGDDTIWGSQRIHIIIHISMSLLILILALCLIYVLITRRNPKSTAIQFNSKLYQERPTSMLPLNGAPNSESPAL